MWKKGIQVLIVFLILSSALFPLMLWAYREGNIATWIISIIFFLLTIYFMLKSKGDNTRAIYSGLFGGYFAWTFTGEVMVHLGFLPIDEWISIPALVIFTIFTIFIIVGNLAPSGIQFFLGHFNILWLFHIVLMTEYHLWGKSSPSTFWTFGVFFLLFAFSIYRLIKSRTEKEGISFGIATLYTFWTMIELIKGWVG